MRQRDQRDPHDGDLPEAVGRGFVRRGRRFTPPGEPPPRSRARQSWSRSGAASVQIGDVVAELTPRQAVVWLMNLDTMVSLYESTTDLKLDAPARERLVQALRGVIRERGTR